MRSVESRLSIHCSFGDHNMQVSTLGRGGGAGGGGGGGYYRCLRGGGGGGGGGGVGGGSGYSNSLRL